VKDPARAKQIAGRLDQLNGERQQEERRILQAIEARFEQEPTLKDAHCVVIDGDGWHRGVIGITATRVVERYGRPTLCSPRGRRSPWLGPIHSCLSPAGRARVMPRPVHPLRRALPRVGFSLPSARVPELRAHLDEYARLRLTPADFEPILDLDAD